MTILLYILFTLLGASIAVFAISAARMSSNIDEIYDKSLESNLEKEQKYSKVQVEELCRKAFADGNTFLNTMNVDIWIETNLY